MQTTFLNLLILLAALKLASCSFLRSDSPARNAGSQPLLVTATAYNSVPEQTDDTPLIAAWGDRLDAAVPSIAVSRDLIDLGLTRGARVCIEGFDEEFLVLDKMNKRWRRRIDIYMGDDVEAAKAWGKRRVHITWRAAAN